MMQKIDQKTIVRLGNARYKCAKCGADNTIDPVEKYMKACVLKLQYGNIFVIRSSVEKLGLAESILGFLYPLGIREMDRQQSIEKITVNGKEIEVINIDITAEKR